VRCAFGDIQSPDTPVLWHDSSPCKAGLVGLGWFACYGVTALGYGTEKYSLLEKKKAAAAAARRAALREKASEEKAEKAAAEKGVMR